MSAAASWAGIRRCASALLASVLLSGALSTGITQPAAAMSLELPWPAQETADQRLGHDSYRLPVSPWREGRMEEIRAEGPIVTRAWRVMASGMTTLQILAPLREQLLAAGFEPLCECSDRDCGGFDFRFHAEILPEPEMHVDLGDFRYLAARRESPAGPEYVALVVSRSEETGFVQLTHIGGEAESPALTASTKSPDAASLQLPQAAPAEPGSLVDALMAQGRATLEDLRFATGASGLEGESFESLEALAAFLRADPSRRVMIVGHTDSQGSLEGNIALSRKRAQAVVDLLVSVYGVSPDQLSAEGVGYLSPRASNDTEEGRALNRRVEAVLQGQ